ncbi:MAG: sigma 54-interacting transcriptional regulator [Solibacillus sp.]|uniref:sigma-54 interaction domain-containing protein n=1 Tax=unclassified Solibacillus TaxID=2637870 RepID=UPI003101ACE1
MMFDQLAAQYSYDGLCVLDKDGTGLYMNPAAAAICNYSIEEFVGHNINEAVKKGEISDSVTSLVARKRQVITKIINIRGVDVLITGTPLLNEDGTVSKVILNVRDIYELNNLKMDQLLSIALKNRQAVVDEFPLDPLPDLEHIVAKSKAFRNVIKLILRITKVDSTVYLRGESGVGKEVVVNLLHQYSARANKPLIKVNCSAIPAPLLEAELFGYEKGAFTGADQRGKPGLFEQADGGTILLDEIGDMPLDLQAKILRVLQEHEVMRIGGRQTIPLNIRVVSATNKDLHELVKEGKFRLDLYYRLNIVPIEIPPLRERKEDIAPLAYYFLQKKNAKYHLNVKFAPGTIHLFSDYDWPGNVREMENMIERLVVMSENNEISWSDLPFIHEQPHKILQKPLKELLLEIEHKIILEKMQQYKTTRKTAEVLGISQSALVKKLQRFDR